MEKALTKIGSFSVSKKAKQEISNFAGDISIFTNTVEEKAKRIISKLKGKPSKLLPDLLREHNLPPGLFPGNIKCYEFDESNSKLIVYLPAAACEATFKDGSVMRYAARVKGTLSRGKLSAIDGMKTKVLMWVNITTVTVESYKSDKISFITAAGMKKSRPKDAYEIARDAVNLEEF